jgi:tRNA-dihydrouridine synthase B
MRFAVHQQNSIRNSIKISETEKLSHNHNMDQPISFKIGAIPIHGDIVLAPMDGFTDSPFRLLCRELGSAVSYTEFVNVDEIAFARQRHGPSWCKLRFVIAERPIAFQIYGNSVPRMVEMAERLADMGADILDVNLGCSIHKIAERGAGAGMLKEPGKIGELFAGMKARLRIPVTAKIRLGWDDASRNYLEVARILEDNGCDLIAVHARTKEQGFAAPVDWAAIGEVKARARIPVLGNGNVHTVADIERMKAETDCDGVMIGRAAIGHPWIFSRRNKEDVPLGECVAMAMRHLQMVIELYGDPLGSVIFRKHAVKYVHHIQKVGELRQRLGACSSPAAYEELFRAALHHAERLSSDAVPPSSEAT